MDANGTVMGNVKASDENQLSIFAGSNSAEDGKPVERSLQA